MESLSTKIDEAKEIYNEAKEKHEPTHDICLFSGGHDSIVSTHFAMEYMDADFVLHLDTGIGIPRVREYVKDVCEHFDWELKIYKATEYVKGDGTKDPQVYEEICKKHGFPGPDFHKRMYQRLKERPLLQCIREHKVKRYSCLLLCTGRYKKESQRRMRLPDEQKFYKKRSRLWCSPLFFWHPEHFEQYRNHLALPKNPVAEDLCISGECQCNAFGMTAMEEIEAFYPEFAERLKKIEKEVKKEGHDWGWDEHPPSYTDSQDVEEEELEVEMELCANCEVEFKERKRLAKTEGYDLDDLEFEML